MLFNLKKKTSPKLTLPKTFGSVKSPFDPLTLPTYQAGYLMNYENDPIPGSMLSTAPSQWLDAVLLNITAKYFQANSNNIPVLVNGFKTFNLAGVIDHSRNVLFDVFNGVSDYTQVIGFQTSSSGTKFLFYRQNATSNLESWILLRGTKIEVQMTDGTHPITLTTLFDYNDGVPHIVIATYNQTLKQVDLYTDLGEHLTGSNAAFISRSLNAGNFNQIVLGNWFNFDLSFNPGLICDFFIYKSILNLSNINSLFAYESNRLNIAYVPF